LDYLCSPLRLSIKSGFHNPWQIAKKERIS
jgi:hypothetical protein